MDIELYSNKPYLPKSCFGSKVDIVPYSSWPTTCITFDQPLFVNYSISLIRYTFCKILIFYIKRVMEVNMNESINSLFDSLDEWLNDESRIVRFMLYIHILFRHVVNTGTEPFRSWANSLPGANRPIGPWPIRYLALSLLGPYAPWPISSRAILLPGTFAPWREMARPFRSRERKFLLTFAPWNFIPRKFGSPNVCLTAVSLIRNIYTLVSSTDAERIRSYIFLVAGRRDLSSSIARPFLAEQSLCPFVGLFLVAMPAVFGHKDCLQCMVTYCASLYNSGASLYKSSLPWRDAWSSRLCHPSTSLFVLMDDWKAHHELGGRNRPLIQLSLT